jgi:hypothetical protein
VIVVAAAGNLNSSSEQYPAAEDGAIAVTAIGPEAKKSPFANYGSWVDIAAPGESIFSALPIDGYAQWSGTSMATAFVTGQATLIRSAFPSLPVANVSQHIQATAQPIDEVNPGYQGLLGAGLADIGASVSQPAGSSDVLYISASADGTAGGVLSFRDEDILAFDAGAGLWSMYFDGSDVGLGATDIDAFDFMPDGAILLSLDSSFKVPGVGTVADADIVKFIPTAVGNNTAGTFAIYLDGSDVGLTSAAEDIDAIGLMPDGQLVVSTLGNFNVGVMGKDEDLLRFTALSLGWHSQGSWSMHFDGSDVGLTHSAEDVSGAWLDSASSQIYLSTSGPFSVVGSSGDGADIFICAPGSVGDQTACTFGPGLYWDGSANGLAGKAGDGIFIAGHP